MSSICQPTRATVRGLRREAYRMLRDDARRSEFPCHLRVGRLDTWPAQVHACEVPRVPSRDLAVDVADALLLDRRTPCSPHVWLTRPGSADTDHLDADWLATLRGTARAHDLPAPDLFVVTRTGWQHVGGAAGQRWNRLRLVLPPE
ncbi:hypothetical protein KLP28_01795 [Nocardioidaceae bacterium]|nr:hypothetical protein KLP28_01795 [Nocardioidaceae bacterium]